MPTSKAQLRGSPRPLTPVLNVPAYFLYGEDWTAESFGFVHVEPLSHRNEPNQWRIGLHMHPDFHQLSIVFEGECSFEHDGHMRSADASSCVFTPANVVHQFHYRPDSRGYVISISPDLVESLVLADAAVRAAMSRLVSARVVAPLSAACTDMLEQLLPLMNECSASQHVHRRETLRHLFGALVLQLDHAGDEADTAIEAPSSTLDTIFQRFSALMETEIGALGLSKFLPDKPYTTEAFAARLSTSAYALNQACRHYCARSAHEIIQAALLGQATRLLLYTNRSVKEISWYLGYSHPSHFGRFFKRHRDMTPEMFRHRHGPPVGPGGQTDFQTSPTST